MPRISAPPNPLAERIVQRAKEIGAPLKGPRGVLAAAQLSSSFVTDLRRKPETSPRAASLNRLADVLGVELNWLVDGKGPKLARGSRVAAAESMAGLLAIPEFVVPLSQPRVDRRGGAALSGRQLELPTKFMLPLASGELTDLSFSEAVGDAMSPLLNDGDIVIVDRAARDPAQGGVYGLLLFERDTLVFRRVQRVPASRPTYRITAENGAYEPIDVPADELEIVGRVVWFGRRI